jgi:hypothetical protein
MILFQMELQAIMSITQMLTKYSSIANIFISKIKFWFFYPITSKI